MQGSKVNADERMKVGSDSAWVCPVLSQSHPPALCGGSVTSPAPLSAAPVLSQCCPTALPLLSCPRGLSLVPMGSSCSRCPPAGGAGRAVPRARDAVQDGVELGGERVLRARVAAAPGLRHQCQRPAPHGPALPRALRRHREGQEGSFHQEEVQESCK